MLSENDLVEEVHKSGLNKKGLVLAQEGQLLICLKDGDFSFFQGIL